MKYILFFILFVFFLIQLSGCTPMAGTIKLIDRSLPDNPRWTSTIPQSRANSYFVGISDNKNSLDIAKKAAIVDALNDAINKKGIEVSINYKQLTDNEKVNLMDQITLGGTARIGLEHVAWYTEVWEHYYKDSAEQKYRAFVLMRSKKLKQDGFLKMAAVNVGDRFNATWHSMLIPGWGQIRTDKKAKGKLFFFTELGVAAGLGYLHARHEMVKRDYHKLKLDFDYELDSSLEKLNLEKRILDKEDEKKLLREYIENFTKLGLGIYAINLIDAIIFGVPSHDKFTQVKLNDRILITSTMKEEIPMVNLSIKF